MGAASHEESAFVDPHDGRLSARRGLEPWTLRVGLVATGLIAWNAASSLWEGGSTPIHAHATALMLLGYLAGFATIGVGILGRKPPRRMHWAVVATLLVVALCYLQNHAVARLENGRVTTDVQIYMDYAARLLRDGINPYTQDLLDAYRINRMPLVFSTPLLDGSLTGRVAYPALSFLLFVPFQWLQVPSDWVYPLFLFLTLGALYARAPRVWRPLVLLPFFLDSRFILYTLGGVSDCVWALLLSLMVLQWDRPRWRAVWFGLAAAYKHQPWVLAPFLLIRLWHDTPGDRRAKLTAMLRFGALSSLTFVIVNLPFIVWAPEAWFRGVFEPVVAPMITFGQGLSALTMSGIAIFPKWLFTLLMAVAAGLLLFLVHRYYRRLRLVIWLAPGFALWLSNRSLTSYWYFFLFPLMADLVTRPLEQPPPKARASTAPSSRRRWAALLAGAILVGAAVGGVAWLAWPKAAFRIDVIPPLITNGPHVVGLTVAVVNTSGQRVRPRFSVQSGSLQPYFWQVNRGPDSLGPTERAVYQLRARAHYERFGVRRGARLIVGSSNSFNIRASTLIPGDLSDVYRDVIPNGQFRYWEEQEDHPTFWGAVRTPSSQATIRPGLPGEAGAAATSVVFTLGPDSTSGESSPSLVLDTYMSLPMRPIVATVWLPELANRLPELEMIYGLRLLLADREVLILFGDEHAHDWLSGTQQYWMIPAPREQWSAHTIDLRHILNELGVSTRPLAGERTLFRDWDYPVVPVNLQLFFASQGRVGSRTARFGPLRSSGSRPDLEGLFHQSLRHPEITELWRGDLAYAYQNYAQARDHYATAVRLAPDSAGARVRLGEAEFWLGHAQAATDAFLAATQLDVRNPLAYKGLGWSTYRLGRTDEAITAWQSAVYLFESRSLVRDKHHHADALKGLSMVMASRGRCVEAQEHLRRAQELRPGLSLPNGAQAACRKATADEAHEP